MELLSIKEWNEYSKEDRLSLISFWWLNYGKSVLESDLDSSIAGNWWYLFGRSVITLEEWKELKKAERTDAKEIDDLKSICCDLNLDINKDGQEKSVYHFKDYLVGCLITAYNENQIDQVFSEKAAKDRQFVKKA